MLIDCKYIHIDAYKLIEKLTFTLRKYDPLLAVVFASQLDQVRSLFDSQFNFCEHAPAMHLLLDD